MSRKSNLTREGYLMLKQMYRVGYGQHKADDIHGGGGTVGKIYSHSTYCNYLKNWARFCAAVVPKHPEIRSVKDAAKVNYVQEWVNDLNTQDKSAWTVHAYAAAAIKVLGLDGQKIKIDLPKRERINITRSREVAARDVFFSPAHHAEVISFCEATGLRRREAEALKGTDLMYQDNSPCVHVICGKGGKERVSPIIGTPEAINSVVDRMRTASDGKVWPQGLPRGMDVHYCRAGYAATIYHQLERPLDQLTKHEKFYCRKDKLGYVYDRAALSAASKALGHGHFDKEGVWHDNPREVAEHYSYRF